MSARRKPTKYERVRIDFAIEFKDAHDSVAFGGQEDFGLLEAAIFEALRASVEAPRIEAVRNVSISFGLDMRKRDADGKVIR